MTTRRTLPFLGIILEAYGTLTQNLNSLDFVYEIAEIFTIDSPLSLTARVDDLRIIYCVAGSRSFGISKLKKPHILIIFSIISFTVRVQNCKKLCLYKNGRNNNFTFFFGGLQCAGHSFAYVAHFLFLRTQRAAGASRRATTLTTHLPNYKIILYVHCISTQL